MKQTKITCRVWEGSKLIGKTGGHIEETFGVKFEKVSRGKEASDSKELKIENADYIDFEGGIEACLTVLRCTH